MTSQYGVDVALERADDLDRLCIEAVRNATDCKVLELGSGRGGLTRRLVAVGASVTAIDIFDYSTEYSSFTNTSFVHGDMRDIAQLLNHQTFDLCVVQRVIHYLPYQEALEVLVYLKSVVTGKLYISVTGIDSDIGDHYPAKAVPLAERFAFLDKVAQTTFSITEPVCLYTPVEFIVLLVTAGFEVEECWVSAFGNIKAICS